MKLAIRVSARVMITMRKGMRLFKAFSPSGWGKNVGQPPANGVYAFGLGFSFTKLIKFITI